MQTICLIWATFWWLIHTYHTLTIHLLHCNYNFPVIWKILHLVICVYSLTLRKQSVQSELQMLFFIKNSDEFRVVTDTDEVSTNYVHRQLSATVHI